MKNKKKFWQNKKQKYLLLQNKMNELKWFLQSIIIWKRIEQCRRIEKKNLIIVRRRQINANVLTNQISKNNHEKNKKKIIK